jgi:probable HAF family extracellular repeat protein
VVGNSAPIEHGAFFGDCPTVPVAVKPQHAALWENGTVTDLGTLGGIFSIAKGINDHGRIVGSSTLASGEEHAFLLRDGTMTDLGTLGGTYSLANQINNHGQAVGLSRIASGELHAFLWEEGAMTDLNNLIPAGSGWILVEATAINKAGQIAGKGTINGQTRAFLLTPDDEND